MGSVVALLPRHQGAFLLVDDGPVVIGGLDTQRLIQDWNSLTPFLKKLIGNLIKRRQEAASKLISMIASEKK